MKAFLFRVGIASPSGGWFRTVCCWLAVGDWLLKARCDLRLFRAPLAGPVGKFGAWGAPRCERIGDGNLTTVLTRRLLAATAVLGTCLALGGCSSVAGFVSDSVPTWAGGMPKDVPPRPGAPGYEEFIAHQQRQDTAAAPAGTPPQAGPTTAPSTTGTTPRTASAVPNPAAPRAAPQQFPPAYAPPDDHATTRGGLY